MQRGEVWWIDFGAPRESEPGFLRPGVILSSDAFNRTPLRTLIVAAVTTNPITGSFPGNFEIGRSQGVERASFVNLTQIAAVNRSDMIRRLGRLNARQNQQLDAGLRLVLDL